ncbi:MAG: transglutaminase-like domain-containing protein [Bacteroidetes bacterium]|nr:transglutaminase-like domain-containing protein [Bacteroidota bacterium]
MRNKTTFLILISFLLSISACRKNTHFISDKQYRHKVEFQFEQQKKLAKNRSVELFKVFDQSISVTEKEALQFLFAFMPLSDLADYNGDFYLKNVSTSLMARDSMSWGKTIPEDIFRHFVLPIRVNNENLDSARWVFFNELKGRVRKMSMKDAVLEVNHWCHEKVTYRGTDIRTSSPLATVKTAFGRCGEESTFTVAALRSVAIPSRQCYTPRWAHCDDNHAWVEVWIDGKWHFIGACEPEAETDLAWFTGPAKRAMLVNTNVFGDYQGPEDVLIKDPRYTKINILPNYTSTKRIWVKVVDNRNKPMDSAKVEFSLYNYAEFYPLTSSFTDKTGKCSFLTGYGDLMVWAAKDAFTGHKKITVKSTDTTIVEILRQPEKYQETESFDLVPPPVIPDDHKINDSLREVNSKKLVFEDRIRSHYEETFFDSSKTMRLAKNLCLNGDTLWNVLRKSRGNWRDLVRFITEVPESGKKWIFPLLNNISDKDLRDASPSVLSDNLENSSPKTNLTSDKNIFNQYVLSPRIDNEFLSPYKEYFLKIFDADFIKDSRKDIKIITDWIRSNIVINNEANYGKAPITPIGVYELKVSDTHSRDILFVAVCRSIGIPARLEPATKIPQYYSNSSWADVRFDNPSMKANLSKGTLILTNNPENKIRPEYYTHFTIEKLTDGFYRSLDYETDPVMQSFPAKADLTPGSYMMVTGNRMTGGTVLVNLTWFNVEPGITKTLDIKLRKELVNPPVLGTIDIGKDLGKLFSGTSSEINTGKGLLLAWIEPDKEPTKHFIADLVNKKEEFKNWKGKILLLFKNENEKNTFVLLNSRNLPSSSLYMTTSSQSLAEFMLTLKMKSVTQLPFVSYINAKGEILYYSEGYNIGLGDDLIKFIR